MNALHSVALFLGCAVMVAGGFIIATVCVWWAMDRVTKLISGGDTWLKILVQLQREKAFRWQKKEAQNDERKNVKFNY